MNFNLKNEDLFNLFSQFGTVSTAKIIMDRETGRSKGFGFVEMDDEEEIKVLPTMNEDEKYEVVSKTTNYPQEILTTLNFLCITLIWTFQFVFPFKDLVTGNFKINKKEFLSTVLNNSYMNYFMFIVKKKNVRIIILIIFK